jgi:hypothetical protein
MEHNQTAETLFNTALLPNFLLWFGVIILMGVLWYLLEYKPHRGDREE